MRIRKAQPTTPQVVTEEQTKIKINSPAEWNAVVQSMIEDLRDAVIQYKTPALNVGDVDPELDLSGIF